MKRYLDFRFDVTDLTVEEREGLAGEVSAQSDRSDLHPSVEVEVDYVEDEDACSKCGAPREGFPSPDDLCEDCDADAAVQRRYDETAEAALRNYVANVSMAGAVFPGPAEAKPKPARVGDEGVLCLYGDSEGGTVVVAAYDPDDAERKLIATFGDDIYIDCIDLSVDQRPLSIRFTAGLTDAEKDDVVLELLRIDSENGGGVL